MVRTEQEVLKMKVVIDISEDYMARLKDITDEDTDEGAVIIAIRYTLDNY